MWMVRKADKKWLKAIELYQLMVGAGRAVGDGGLPGAVAFDGGMWLFSTHSVAERELRKELFLFHSPPAFCEGIVEAPFSVDHKGQSPGPGWRRWRVY